MISPASLCSGTPPGKVIRPPLLCSMPYNGPPGWLRPPMLPVGMSKKRAVLAFLIAMSPEPSHAPSIRMKALRLPPASTTAMFILVSIAAARALAVSMIKRAWSSLMSALFSGAALACVCPWPSAPS